MVKQIRVSGSDVDVVKSHHDLNTTRESIKALLADGTPNWVKWPEDYKAFVQESKQYEKEISDQMVSGYKMEDQELFTNEKARKVHPISTRDFIQKLRRNGVRCFFVDNGWPPQTIALWAFRPYSQTATYVCFLQVPAMYEWSLLRLDRYDLPAGERFRGWRTVLAQMIVKKIITEKQAHDMFGKPTESVNGRRYRETLYNCRNGITNGEEGDFGM